MSDVDGAKADWVTRVLAVDFSERSRTGGDTPSLRRLATCRLDWVKTCSTIRSQVAVLQATIIDCYEQESDIDPTTLSEVTTAVEELDSMISEIDETLADMIDEIINQESGNARAAVISKTTKLTDAYLSLVESDPDFALIDDNEFYPTGVKSLTQGVLERISAELRPLA
jgi:hypothetical protein